MQDPTYYTAAVVMTAVFLFTVLYGRDFGNAVFESVKNTYENEVLVEQLVAEKRMAEEARREAENATRSKTQFFAAASHDLRQPLQAIGIYVSLLKKRAHGPLEPLVNNLSTAVETLSKLVEELAGDFTPRFGIDSTACRAGHDRRHVLAARAGVHSTGGVQGSCHCASGAAAFRSTATRCCCSG